MPSDPTKRKHRLIRLPFELDDAILAKAEAEELNINEAYNEALQAWVANGKADGVGEVRAGEIENTPSREPAPSPKSEEIQSPGFDRTTGPPVMRCTHPKAFQVRVGMLVKCSECGKVLRRVG